MQQFIDSYDFAGKKAIVRVDFNVPLVTDARLAAAYIRAFCTLPDAALEVRNWADYAGKW